MRIEDLESHLETAKNNAITATGVDADTAAEIALAPPPEPDMGDRGFPCFALARHLRKSPASIAADVADALRAAIDDDDIISSVSTAGPYVNLTLDQNQLTSLVVSQALDDGANFGTRPSTDTHWMIEFSAPNTNKPQHLGHVRNNLIGDAVSRILSTAGHQVTRVNLINDRGIHICKSMLAYKLFGDGETPQSTGEKGDHFVGRYYVLFNDKLSAEYDDWKQTDAAQSRFQQWLDSPESANFRQKIDDDHALRETFFEEYANDFFNHESDLGKQARKMLRKWEQKDPDTVELWQQMNDWVFDGFRQTYEDFGIEFDQVYYESDTYQLGKEVVEQGLDTGLFHTRDDGAVVCDLEQVGLDGEKVLLRSDSTTVYMTQDLGTAMARFDDHDPDRMVYVVADEQKYHFDVLFRILGALRPELKGRLHHLSYGMVELPEGKMKSREGTVVDADDLLDEMTALADQAVVERYGDVLDDDERRHRADVIALAALKYYVLDFAPRTTVCFDPERSIDFQGRTGPYCLYGYARIRSIMRRVDGWPTLDEAQQQAALRALGTEREMEVVRTLQRWPQTVDSACDQLNPGRITEYLFGLCRAFSSLYNDPDHRIVELDGPRRNGLLLLARATQHALAAGLDRLGIPTLDEM